VYSTADRDSLHVTYADEDVCIGPPQSKESYLNISRIISAAEITGADAIHPGYGFLAENAHFAEVLNECKLAWIGRGGGHPADGRQGEGAPDGGGGGRAGVPGSKEPLQSSEDAERMAAEVGYPVILKAAAGGGGRGMRIVWEEKEIAGQFATASGEAEKAFGDGSIYLEKYLVQAAAQIEFPGVRRPARPRHPTWASAECSIQRRHQKLDRGVPSPALTPALREEMGAAAVALCRAVGYEKRRHHRVPARQRRPLLFPWR